VNDRGRKRYLARPTDGVIGPVDSSIVARFGHSLMEGLEGEAGPTGEKQPVLRTPPKSSTTP
jgi:hypothetical protein